MNQTPEDVLKNAQHSKQKFVECLKLLQWGLVFSRVYDWLIYILFVYTYTKVYGVMYSGECCWRPLEETKGYILRPDTQRK